MKTQEAWLPVGHPNRSGKKLESLKAMIIHYTQNESLGATDLMNAKYIGRKYIKKTINEEQKSFEADGKTPFSFGSAHVFCDMDSITLAIPTDEVSWGCGDRNFKGGQQPVAATVFNKRANYHTVSVEICNNDIIKNSDEDWKGSVATAKQWTIDFIKSKGLKVDVAGSLAPQTLKTGPKAGEILILRHHDVSGKNCPAPFIKDKVAWEAFVRDVAKAV